MRRLRPLRRPERGARRRSDRRHDSGQATIELIAGVPVLALGALVALQLCAVAFTVHLADGAAEAGALAVAAGEPAAVAARGALPGGASEDVSVEAAAGRVRVEVRPPAPLAAIGEALTVSSTAWARPPDEDG